MISARGNGILLCVDRQARRAKVGSHGTTVFDTTPDVSSDGMCLHTQRAAGAFCRRCLASAGLEAGILFLLGPGSPTSTTCRLPTDAWCPAESGRPTIVRSRTSPGITGSASGVKRRRMVASGRGRLRTRCGDWRCLMHGHNGAVQQHVLVGRGRLPAVVDSGDGCAGAGDYG